MGILIHLFQGKRQTARKKVATWTQPAPINIRHMRRHLPDSPYTLPKDRQEEQRVDFQHHFFYQLLGSHYVAPISQDIDRILDVGSGTGRWSGDMAKIFPLARVIGMDKEAPSPSLLVPPPNYHFVPGNVLEELPFESSSFSYVHQRLLVGAIPARLWPFVLGEFVRVTRPGGYIELVEGGNQYLNAGPATQQIVQWGTQASTSVGIDASLMTNLDDLLERVGGVHTIHKQVLQVPIGRWGGRIGELFFKDMAAVLAGLEDFYRATLGISSERFHVVLNALPEEWEQHHTLYEFYVVYGQRL